MMVLLLDDGSTLGFWFLLSDYGFTLGFWFYFRMMVLLLDFDSTFG